MSDPIRLLRRLTNLAPIISVESDKYECCYCGVYGADAEELYDECNHDEECPWRLAVEYLANLKNEGY